MKTPRNLYLLLALSIVFVVTGSLMLSAGDAVPALFAAILLLVVLVLGWAAGRMDGRAEIARLTSIESARRVQASCLVAMRNRLEDELESLRSVKGGAL